MACQQIMAIVRAKPPSPAAELETVDSGTYREANTSTASHPLPQPPPSPRPIRSTASRDHLDTAPQPQSGSAFAVGSPAAAVESAGSGIVLTLRVIMSAVTRHVLAAAFLAPSASSLLASGESWWRTAGLVACCLAYRAARCRMQINVNDVPSPNHSERVSTAVLRPSARIQSSNVFVTRHHVEVETLERKSQVRAIHITCRANWESELTNALTQATGERTFASSVARIHALRRSVSWLAIFASGCVPHPDVFVAYFAAQILQIGMSAVSLSTFLGFTPREGIDYWIQKRNQITKMLKEVANTIHPVLGKAVSLAMTVKATLASGPTHSVTDAVKDAATLIATLIPDPIKTGCLVGGQGLIISTALLSTTFRLWHNSPLCETAAWSAWTHTPFGIVLLIDYRASKDTPLDDVDQLNQLVAFLVSKVPLAAIVQHNLTVHVNEGTTRNVAVVVALDPLRHFYSRSASITSSDVDSRCTILLPNAQQDLVRETPVKTIDALLRKPRDSAQAHSLLMMIGTAAGHVGRYMATRQLGGAAVVFIDFSILPISTAAPGPRPLDERDILREALLGGSTDGHPLLERQVFNIGEAFDENALDTLLRTSRITWVLHRLDALTPACVTNRRVIDFILHMLRASPRDNRRDKVVVTLKRQAKNFVQRGRAGNNTLARALAEQEPHACTVWTEVKMNEKAQFPSSLAVPESAQFAFVPTSPPFAESLQAGQVYEILVSAQELRLRVTAGTGGKLTAELANLSERQRVMLVPVAPAALHKTESTLVAKARGNQASERKLSLPLVNTTGQSTSEPSELIPSVNAVPSPAHQYAPSLGQPSPSLSPMGRRSASVPPLGASFPTTPNGLPRQVSSGPWYIRTTAGLPFVVDEESGTLRVGELCEQGKTAFLVDSHFGTYFFISVCLSSGEMARLSCAGVKHQLHVGAVATKFCFLEATEAVHARPRAGIKYEIVPRSNPTTRLTVVECHSGTHAVRPGLPRAKETYGLSFQPKTEWYCNHQAFLVHDVQLSDTLDADSWEIESAAFPTEVVDCSTSPDCECFLWPRRSGGQFTRLGHNAHQQFAFVQPISHGTGSGNLGFVTLVSLQSGQIWVVANGTNGALRMRSVHALVDKPAATSAKDTASPMRARRSRDFSK
jgi:hypothetical protein